MNKPSSFFLGLSLLAGVSSSLHATPLTWDIGAGDGVTITDGTGTWTTGGPNWNDGSDSVNWANGDSATFTGATGGTITKSGTITQTGITFNGNANYTVNGTGSLTGAGTLTKNGTGILTLATNNGYTGNTVLSAGTIKTTAAGALANGSITLNDAITGANNTTYSTNQLTNANNIIVANQGTGITTLELTAQNAAFMGASIQLNKATTVQSNYNGAGGAYIGHYGGSSVVSGNVGTLTLKALGTGKLYLLGNNTFTGTVVITQGTVAVGGNANSLGGTNVVNMSGSATLDMASFGSALSIGALSGTSANTLNRTGQALTINSSTTGNFAGGINGSGTVTKTGSGTQIFSGSNSYTGATTIASGGILALTGTGSIANSSNLVVNGTLDVSGLSAATFTIGSGQKLSGDGTVNATGKTLSIAGTHAVGNGPGQQDVTGHLNYASGSIFEWDLNGTTSDPGALANNQGAYDQVAVTGDLTGSGAAFRIILGSNSFGDTFWDTGKTWNNIFTASTSFDLATIFTSFSGTGVSSLGVVDGRGSFSFTGGNTLTWNAVPEPGSALAGLLIGAGLLRRRRA